MMDGVPDAAWTDPPILDDPDETRTVAGPPHRELMARARHLAQFGVMVSDTSRGHIRQVAGRSRRHRR